MATPRMFEWTLEHHKRFLDTFILLDGDNKKVGLCPVLRAELLTLVGCCCGSLFLVSHFILLSELQKKSESLFCNSNKVSLKGLYVAPIKLSSSWTLEHHRRVVEAVIQLGGLSNSKATPKAVLKLMAEEDRRQGLTARKLSHHLSELSRLQKEAQRLISSRPSCVQEVGDQISITAIEV